MAIYQLTALSQAVKALLHVTQDPMWDPYPTQLSAKWMEHGIQLLNVHVSIIWYHLNLILCLFV